jgi:hypothetical protein
MEPVNVQELEQVVGGFTLTVTNVNLAAITAAQTNVAYRAGDVLQANAITVSQRA